MYITDRAYTESQIREMEIKILAALGKIFMLQAAYLIRGHSTIDAI